MVSKYGVLVLTLVAGSVLMSQQVRAQTPDEVLSIIKKNAQEASPDFQGFLAARGEKFFKQKHGDIWSCASCHTENPATEGKHAKTDKIIQPLAPAANAERFTSPGKVDKWFKRNCSDVLARECTPQEKGDVLTYLITVNK